MESKKVEVGHVGVFAKAYHDAMNMVNLPNHPYNTRRIPHWILEDYLYWSGVVGVKLHNDHWVEEARAVVKMLEEKRNEAIKALGDKQ